MCDYCNCKYMPYVNLGEKKRALKLVRVSTFCNQTPRLVMVTGFENDK